MGEVVALEFSDLVARLKPEIDAIVARYPESRSALMPIVHVFQREQGFVSKEAIAQTAQLLGLTQATVESTVSFYSLFFRRPVGAYMLQPCRGLSCIINGAYAAMSSFREKLGLAHLQTSDDGVFSYEEVECLAACDHAPCMQVNREFFYDLTESKIDTMLAQMRAGTFEVPPLVQTEIPAKTWMVTQDSLCKSAGAQHVPDADDPGGAGDLSGANMIAKLQEHPHPIEIRPTRERLVREGAARAKVHDA